VENRHKPQILFLATGGTISMLRHPQTGRSVPTRSAADLLALTAIATEVEVRCVDVTGQSRTYEQPADLLTLVRCLQRETTSDLDGIVITHGTDTLEEVAYLVDETSALSGPLVFTGAMRPGWASGFDGIRNLENAFRVAQKATSVYGTLITLNDEIFEAWSVYKADSGAIDAFAARRGAAIGRIIGDRVEFAWRPVPRARFGKIPESLPTSVPIVTLGVADDVALLDRVQDGALQGMIIAAIAAGSISPRARQRILALTKTGLPVVLCSSATSGRTAEHYYYPGAYDDLTVAGVTIEDYLTPRKARIRLMLSLGLQVPYVPFGQEFLAEKTNT
jgi:L-asparaginase